METYMRSSIQRRLIVGLGAAAALVLTAGVTPALAATRAMPDRQALQGQAVILWGNTTQANGTAFTLDCGNGTTNAGNVTDQSYISRSCTYAAVGTFTASLTVGAETATVDIAVTNPVAGTESHRNTRINMAIQDGL